MKLLSEIRVQQEFAIAFRAQDGGVDVIGASGAELNQSFSNTRERCELGCFVSHDASFAYLLTSGFELRLYQHNCAFAALQLWVWTGEDVRLSTI